MTSLEECIQNFIENGTDPYPIKENNLWCNATYDTILCWPPISAGTSNTVQCPPLKGLDPTKKITKFCHSSGRWRGRNDTDFSKPSGWTNWTECLNEEVIDIMSKFAKNKKKELTENFRYFELIGYLSSVVVLSLVLALYFRSTKRFFFHNQLHIFTMCVVLMVGLIRFLLYLDIISHWTYFGRETTLCETLYFYFEFGKLSAIAWIFLETLYLHNRFVWKIFKADHRKYYLGFGLAFPFANTLIWMLFIWQQNGYEMPQCLSNNKLNASLILTIPKYIMILITFCMLIAIIGFLWCGCKSCASPTNERSNNWSIFWNHLTIVSLLFFLVVVPEILHSYPVNDRDGLLFLNIYIYLITPLMVTQGIIVAMIFLLLNVEVFKEIKDSVWCRPKARTRSHDLILHLQQPIDNGIC